MTDTPQDFAVHAAEHLEQRERKLGQDIRDLLLNGEGTAAQRAWTAVDMAWDHVCRTQVLVEAKDADDDE